MNFSRTTFLIAAAALAGTTVAFAPSTPARASSSALRMADEADFVKTEVAANPVTIFSKSFCPFCSKTKATFAEMGVDAKIYELNQMDNGADIQAALLEMTGQKTVPSVWINGEHLGGNDDTQAAKSSGKLEEMLN